MAAHFFIWRSRLPSLMKAALAASSSAVNLMTAQPSVLSSDTRARVVARVSALCCSIVVLAVAAGELERPRLLGLRQKWC
jgi:hypothetical protein